jgi:glycosyltransferase involved in cell wall biosynthesis
MKSPWPDDIAVLIPAYKAVASLATFLPALLSRVPPANVLVIDDASADATSQLCRSLSIECISLPENRGKGRALATGFERLLARNCRSIITMDADGQHAVDDLPHFLNAIKDHPDAGIIIGKRALKPGLMPFARIVSNTLTSALLTLLTGTRIYDSQSGYRAYNTGFLRRISIVYNRFEMESEVIIKAAKLGYPILFIGVQTLYCSAGSHIAHIPDTLRWVRAVVGTWMNPAGRAPEPANNQP